MEVAPTRYANGIVSTSATLVKGISKNLEPLGTKSAAGGAVPHWYRMYVSSTYKLVTICKST